MRFGYLIVAVLASVVTVFTLQNTDHTTVRLLLWRLEGVPISWLVLASLGAGLPLWIKLT